MPIQEVQIGNSGLEWKWHCGPNEEKMQYGGYKNRESVTLDFVHLGGENVMQ